MRNFIRLVSSFLILVLWNACAPKTSSVVSTTSTPSLKVDQSFRAKVPEAGPSKPIAIGDYQEFSLDNGLRVILVENHKVPKINAQVYVDLNPLLEGEESGYTQLAGELMSTGTTSRRKAQIDEQVDFIGGVLNTSSRGGFASSLKKHFPTLMEIFADVILNPAFPPEEFDKIKKQTLSNLASAKDDPDAISNNLATVVNFGKKHPYGEILTEETVNKITLEKCISYYRDNFKPNVSYLILVGDLNLAEAKETAQKYFGNWQQGQVTKNQINPVLGPIKSEVHLVDKSSAVQSAIKVTYPVDLKPGTPEIFSSRILNTILGHGGSTGRLFQNLRETKAYTYGAYSSLTSDQWIGKFEAEASVRNAVTDSSIMEILNEMNRIRNELVSDNDLRQAKNITAGQFARSMENPQTIANFALNISRYRLPKDYYNTYLTQIDRVSAIDVQNAAKRFIRPDEANVVVVGSQEEILDKLKKNWTVKYYDLYGNPIQLAAKKEVESGVNALSIIVKFLNKIGGKEKLTTVKNIKVEMTATTQMGELTMTLWSKNNEKSAMTVSVGGMIVQEQRYDGQTLRAGQMGTLETVTDDKMVSEAKEQAQGYFQELFYLKPEYKLELKGLETLNGKNAYKLNIVSPSGSKTVEFYDQETGLKLRQIQTQEAQGQSISNTMDFEDYRSVEGVMIPHKVKLVSAAIPFPLDFEVKKVEVNQNIDDAVFK